MIVSASVLCFCLVLVGVTCDQYLEEVQDRCDRTHRPLPCVKYRLLRYVDNYQWRDVNLTGDSSVRIVDVPGPYDKSAGLFPESRQFSQDSELTKIYKFVQRQVERLLNSRGLSVVLPEGARVLQDDIGRKRKSDKKTANVVIPLLILFKLFKIKTLVAITLAGIVLIKKAILVAAFLLPSIINSLKQHCKTQYHVVPHYVEDPHHYHSHEHQSEDSHESFGWSGYANNAYGGGDNKDWDRYKKVKRGFQGYR